MSKSKTPYDILEVTKDADADAIKKSYRKLAMKHHPDKGGSTEKFQQIVRAYDVLSDTEKRRYYDEHGEEKKSKKDIAIAHLVSLMREVIEQDPRPEASDLFAMVKKHIDRVLADVRSKIETLNRHTRKYEKLRKRFHRKKDGENFMEGLVEQTIQEDKTKLAALEEDLKMGEEMLRLVNDYSFQQDSSAAPIITMFLRGSGT
jgi:curved DNA-binding protein CbpA